MRISKRNQIKMTQNHVRYSLFFFTVLLLFSCKKEKNQYNLFGITLAAHTQQGLSNVSIDLQKQSVQSGVYSTTFNSAANAVSNGKGEYSITWDRENFAAMKLICEKQNYIKTEIELDVAAFDAGDLLLQNVVIQPEAFVQVHIRNTSLAESTDQFRFTFANAQFDCVCCANEWKEFSGENVDTTFTCRLYGETWLRFQKDYFTAQNDTMLIDSIFCPAFQTTNLEINY
jgi:hypothetical protein